MDNTGNLANPICVSSPGILYAGTGFPIFKTNIFPVTPGLNGNVNNISGL